MLNSIPQKEAIVTLSAFLYFIILPFLSCDYLIRFFRRLILIFKYSYLNYRKSELECQKSFVYWKFGNICDFFIGRNIFHTFIVQQ